MVYQVMNCDPSRYGMEFDSWRIRFSRLTGCIRPLASEAGYISVPVAGDHKWKGAGGFIACLRDSY